MSAESYIVFPPQSTGPKVRTRQRSVSGNLIQESYVIVQQDRIVSNYGFASSFMTTGSNTTGQILFSIENSGTSSVIVGVRRLTVQEDPTAATTGIMAQIKTARTAGSLTPTTGTLLTKGQFDTSLSSSTNVQCRGSTASDAGAATPIGAYLNPHFWNQYTDRTQTAVGQLQMDDNNCMPIIAEDNPIYLTGNQALVVFVSANGGSNPATDNYIVQCFWEEFNL